MCSQGFWGPLPHHVTCLLWLNPVASVWLCLLVCAVTPVCPSMPHLEYEQPTQGDLASICLWMQSRMDGWDLTPVGWLSSLVQ